MTGELSAAAPAELGLPLTERVARATDDPTWGRACADTGAAWARIADAAVGATTELDPNARPLIRVGVKDNIHVAGFHTGYGTRHHRERPTATAPVAARLPAGEITCKTKLSQLTLGKDCGCANPLRPGLWPGASSGGSAAAVAANICDFALGTDSVGSVRIPSVACGVVGLRLSRSAELLDGVLAVSPTLDAPGVFARTTTDLAFALDRLGLGHGRSPDGAARVLSVAEVFYGDTSGPVIRLFEDALEHLAAAGADVLEQDIGEVWGWRTAAWELCAHEAATELASHPAAQGPLDADVLAVLRMGAAVPAARAQEIRAALPCLARATEQVMQSAGAGVLALPVLPYQLVPPQMMAHAASLFPDWTLPVQAEVMAGFTPVASLLGWPCLSVPYGHDLPGGLPQFGIQLIGRPGTEAHLVSFAEHHLTTRPTAHSR